MWMKTRRYPLWRWLEKSIEKQKMKIIFQPGMEKVFKKGEEHGLDSELIEKIFTAIHQASIDVQTHVMKE